MIHPGDARRYNIVIFQKAYTLEHLDLARSLSSSGTKVVFDLCDNHFYVPEDQPQLKERGDRVRRMVEVADLVTVSTEALAEFVPVPTVVVDDMVELPRIAAAPRTAGADLRLAWFGNAGSESPAFGLVDLASILPELEALARKRSLSLTVISNSRTLFDRYVEGKRVRARYVRWRQASQWWHLQRAAVCVLPVTLNPFTACKSNNRVATAMMHGLPVVAGRVPSYGVFSPFLAYEDWVENISRYASSRELVEEHVRGGQRLSRTLFDPARVGRQWEEALAQLL